MEAPRALISLGITGCPGSWLSVLVTLQSHVELLLSETAHLPFLSIQATHLTQDPLQSHFQIIAIAGS